MALMTKVINSHFVSNFNALCNHALLRSKLGHMAFASVSSRFGIASFFVLGKRTLSFIMLRLLSWLHLVIYKGKKSSLIPHSFCIHTPSFFYTEKPFVLNKTVSPSS